MTKQPLYTHTNYIWHFLVLRLIVISPFVAINAVTNFIANTAEKVCWKLDKMLPVSYHQTKVPFEQLSKREQKEIERLAKARKSIRSQVYQG
jgi:hypothetical protein